MISRQRMAEIGSLSIGRAESLWSMAGDRLTHRRERGREPSSPRFRRPLFCRCLSPQPASVPRCASSDIRQRSDPRFNMLADNFEPLIEHAALDWLPHATAIILSPKRANRPPQDDFDPGRDFGDDRAKATTVGQVLGGYAGAPTIANSPAASGVMSTVSGRAPSRATCLSRSRRTSSCSSTRRPPRRSAALCRNCCLLRPTRSLSNAVAVPESNVS